MQIYLGIIVIKLVSYLFIVINSFKAWTPLDASPCVVILSDFIIVESTQSLKTHFTMYKSLTFCSLIDLETCVIFQNFTSLNTAHKLSAITPIRLRSYFSMMKMKRHFYAICHVIKSASRFLWLYVTFFIIANRVAKSLSYVIYNQKPFLYTINLVRTKMIKTVRRNARVKAIAITSQYPWITVFKVSFKIKWINLQSQFWF